MLNIDQFRKYIIQPPLKMMSMYSEATEELLVFTCAVESDGGSFVHQLNGYALGIYQMQVETYTDLWDNYIKGKPQFCMAIAQNFNSTLMPHPERMVYDLWFATIMARIHYARVFLAIPMANDIEGIWAYYKRFYNTPNGKAEKESSIKKYHNFLGGVTSG